tara:strand:+ start:1001 stop:1468 length:468 start_codon:yes stop_codon:yes gene_type:complete
MKKLLLLVPLLASCSTLAPIAGGAIGGAAGSLGGPATAAIGGAAGVTVAQMTFPSNSTPVSAEVALAAAQSGKPAPGTVASTIHETKGLVWDLGWMYLLIFIIVPFFSKRGRTWMKKFTDIGNTVSQKDIDARDEEQDIKIKDLEQKINNLLGKK